jgi:hypothetical protein
MSLLSHQSSVNPTTTFWSKTAEVPPLPGQFAFVASDPKEYLIRFSCIEIGKDDEREERVIISVRDPNISEARINELMEMAN